MEFEIGDVCEGQPWEIEFNYKVCEWLDVKMCPHCHSRHEEVTTRSDGSTFSDTHFICPRVVIARNEGGHAITAVCLDCILEAAKTLDEARK